VSLASSSYPAAMFRPVVTLPVKIASTAGKKYVAAKQDIETFSLSLVYNF
jgi:hypothetical protein